MTPPPVTLALFMRVSVRVGVGNRVGVVRARFRVRVRRAKG